MATLPWQAIPPEQGTPANPGGQGTSASEANTNQFYPTANAGTVLSPDPFASKSQITGLTNFLLSRAKTQSLGDSAITQAGSALSNQLAVQMRLAQKPTVDQLLSDEHFGGRTTWQEAKRALSAEEQNILDHAVGQGNLADLTREDLANNLLGVGLNRDQTDNLLDRAGLAERELGLETGGWAPGPGGFNLNSPNLGLVKTQGRIDLQEASVGDAISYLTQTLADVNLDENSFDRQIDTLSDQISMTADQKTEIGLQKTDVNTMDTIAAALRTARDTALGDSLEVGKGRIALVQSKADLDKRATELQSDRAERAALRDAYSRGASFTTGIREDVADIELGKQLALDEIALQSSGADLSLTELMSEDTFQKAQLTAEKDRAAVDLDSNLRQLDLEFTDVGYLADRYGRSKSDVTDAISRLDTNRLAIQTGIADEARKLTNLGLDRQQVEMRLQSIGYDRVDANIALKALKIEEDTIGVAGKRVTANEVLSELAIDRSLESLESKRAGVEIAEADENAALAQWDAINAAMTTEESEREMLGSYAASTAANRAVNAAMEQYAPLLRGLTKAQYEQMSELFANPQANLSYEMDPLGAIQNQLYNQQQTSAMSSTPGQPYIDQSQWMRNPSVTFNPTFNPTINVPPSGFTPEFPGDTPGDGVADPEPPVVEDPGGGVSPGSPEFEPPGGGEPEGGESPGGAEPGGGHPKEDPKIVPPVVEPPVVEPPVVEPPGGAEPTPTPTPDPAPPPAPANRFPPGFYPGPGGVPRTDTDYKSPLVASLDKARGEPDWLPVPYTPTGDVEYLRGGEQPGGIEYVGHTFGDMGNIAGTAATPSDFATDVLAGIGAPVTDNNLATLALWQNMEGQTDQGLGMTGAAAEFNPLATTYGRSQGYDPYNYDETGDPLVWNYPDYQTGVDNTVSTLELGYYDPLVAALQQDIDAATMNYMPEVTNALGTWSGKGYGGFANAGEPAWMDELVSQLGNMGGNAVLPVREPQTSFVSAPTLTEQYPELAFFY